MSNSINEVDKLAVWDEVSKTDPSATKTSNQGGRQQTSIDGYWMIQEATKMFGPVGIGWGWDVIEERWDNGALIPIKQDDGSVRLEQSKTHTIKLKLWYEYNGRRGEIIQYGHTQAIYKSKWGVSDDGEAPKKSLMDAIKKSLSMLGFCADIFMGKFEDNEYVEKLITENQIEKAENIAEEQDKKRQDIIDYVLRQTEAIERATTKSELSGIEKVAIRHLTMQSNIKTIAQVCTKGIEKIAIEVNKRKEAFDK